MLLSSNISCLTVAAWYIVNNNNTCSLFNYFATVQKTFTKHELVVAFVRLSSFKEQTMVAMMMMTDDVGDCQQSTIKLMQYFYEQHVRHHINSVITLQA